MPDADDPSGPSVDVATQGPEPSTSLSFLQQLGDEKITPEQALVGTAEHC